MCNKIKTTEQLFPVTQMITSKANKNQKPPSQLLLKSDDKGKK